eukprot:jgi/Botrbrau1/10117/Bobra.20_2s0024.1
MPRFPMLKSVWVTLRYHLGSVAMGSLVIAIVQFVRLLLEWVHARTRRYINASPASKFIKPLVWVVRCLLWLLEKIVKFINRNAYIVVATQGTSYCKSVGQAASLIINNALRVAAVNTVGDSLIFLGKVSVMAATGVVAFLMSNSPFYTDPVKYPSTFLSSPFAPILLCLFVGYVIGSIFFSVYEMTVDTILLSFCKDCESHRGHPQYAPPLLLDAIGDAEAKRPQKKTPGAPTAAPAA